MEAITTALEDEAIMTDLADVMITTDLEEKIMTDLEEETITTDLEDVTMMVTEAAEVIKVVRLSPCPESKPTSCLTAHFVHEPNLRLRFADFPFVSQQTSTAAADSYFLQAAAAAIKT